MKVKDGATGKIGWRQAKRGFLKDYDGEPTSQNHQFSDLKNRPQHYPKTKPKRLKRVK